MRWILAPLVLAIFVAWPAFAQRSAAVEELAVAMRLGELVGIMHQEGLAYGAEMEQEMFPGRGGDRWLAAVGTIYDTGRMLDTLTATLEEDLSQDDLGVLIGFFAAPEGAAVIEREIAARRALLDPEAEEDSRVRFQEMRADDDPRLDLIERLIAANDLVEHNVAGALNSNFAFYAGLAEGGAFSVPITESEMLRDVWEQEPEIRAETEEWLYSYLATAYAPVSDAVLDAYIDLSNSEAGRALNAALFAGFDRAFNGISRDLGVVAARFIVGEDI